MITKDKVIEIFCIVDEFCKEYEKEIKKHQLEAGGTLNKRNRKGQMSQSEIITIMICFHFGTHRNFKHYYLVYIKEYLKDYFPNSVSYNRFVELQPRCVIPFMLLLKLVGFGKCTGITYIDSTPIKVCNNKRIKRNKVFSGMAEVGKGSMGWFFGFKLHLVCNERGELLNFSLTKGNVDDRNPDVINVLSGDLIGKLYADKGYISKNLFEALFDKGIHLITGIRANMKNKFTNLKDKIILRKRAIIETINDELKNICQVEHTRHRSSHNFIMNIIAALTAYCFFPKKPSINFEVEKIDQLTLWA